MFGSRSPDIISYIPPKAVLDPKTSRRIFELAKDQQDELEHQEEEGEEEEDDQGKFMNPRTQSSDGEDDEQSDGSDVDIDENIDEIFVGVQLSSITTWLTFSSAIRLW